MATDIDTQLFGAALCVMGEAGAALESDDQRLPERGVYDARYAHCQYVSREMQA
jgi:hypothetical protein